MGYLIMLMKYWKVSNANDFMICIMKEILKYKLYYDQFHSLHALFKALNYKIIKGLVFNPYTEQWEALCQRNDVINDLNLLNSCIGH